MTLQDNFGAIVRRLRTSKRMTLEAVARKADLSLASVWNVEAGRTNGEPETRRAIARALGTDYDALMALVERNPLV